MVLIVIGFNAQAESYVDVEYPVGTNLNGSKIFKAENIYPGWSESKTIRVRNKNTEDKANIFFKFNVKGNKFGKKLNLYVVRKKDNSYRIGGAGDRWTLDSFDGKLLYVDRLDPKESKQYIVEIKFDKDAGNEYQGLNVKFDIDFNLEEKISMLNISEQQNEINILNSEGREDFTGNPPAELGKETKNINGSESGKTLEKENNCKSLPFWVWFLSIIAFLGLSLFSTYKTKTEKIKQHFGLQLGGVVGAILLWYYLDQCHYYGWFPVSVIIVGIANHIYYQKFKLLIKT